MTKPTGGDMRPLWSIAALLAAFLLAVTDDTRAQGAPDEVVVRYVRAETNYSGQGKLWFQLQNRTQTDWRVTSIRCEIATSEGMRVMDKSFEVSVMVFARVPIRESDPQAISDLPRQPRFKCRVMRAAKCDGGRC
jgi:hypothetical protein